MKNGSKDLLLVVEVLSDIANHKVKELEARRLLLSFKLETMNFLHPGVGRILIGFEASVEDAELRDVCIQLLETECSASAAIVEARRQYSKLIYMKSSS